MSICKTLVLFLFASLVAAPVNSQTYPSKPVRLLIGNPPGGPSDFSLRGIAQVLGQSMNQSFVVENRLGAGGLIAGDVCAKAAPDGYTLCMADSFNIALNPVARKNMPYDPERDYAAIIHTGFLPASIWVNAGLPVNSMAELLELAKTKPDTVNWATFGNASSSDLYVAWLKNVRNINFANIPYKSAQDAWQSVLAGQSNVAVYAARAGMPQMNAGKVKMLAISTDVRMPYVPNVPTIRESGIDIALITWFGIFTAATTPREIVHRLNAEIAKGMFETPANREKFIAGQGLEVYGPVAAAPEVFAAFNRSQREMYANLVRIAKISIE